MAELVKHAPYRPNARKLAQLFAVGFIASLVAFFLTTILAWLGAPVTDLSALFGSLFEAQLGDTNKPGVLWAGIITYFLAGSVVFPIAFDYFADREILTNRRWLKGHLFAVALWLLAECLLKPVGGFGLFSTKMANPLGSVLISFIVWLTYALTLEIILRVRIAHGLHVPARSDREAA